jgi:2-hydroxy-6-oxonona-2,4-dienedioate hydrolase
MIGTEAAAGVGSFLDVDGIQTFFVEQGDGEAVVMIHGAALGVSAQMSWQPNLAPLAKAGFWTIAYDQPGFGHSSVPADHSVEYRVQHARAFIDALGLTHYHLIGSSMGAYVAARLALEDTRVDRLVLVAGSALVPSRAAPTTAGPQAKVAAPTIESVRALTAATLQKPELVTEALVQARFAMSSGAHHAAFLARQATGAPRPLTDALSALTHRTLILWGKNDAGAPLEQATALFQAIPGAELHVFDNCGHWVQWDQASRANRLIADFLRAE